MLDALLCSVLDKELLLLIKELDEVNQDLMLSFFEKFFRLNPRLFCELWSEVDDELVSLFGSLIIKCCSVLLGNEGFCFLSTCELISIVFDFFMTLFW